MRRRTWLLLLLAWVCWPLSLPARPPLRPAGPDDGSVATLAGLTPRQREIARLVGAGLLRKQIGARLGIKEATVANHLWEIYRVTGVTGITGLAVWASRQVDANALAERVERAIFTLPPHFCRGKRFVHAAGVIERVRFVLTGETEKPA